MFPSRLGTPARIALGFLVAAAVWFAGLQWFVMDIGRQAAGTEQAADAIVVLTGGSKRIETGFRLLKEGRGKKLFISGVYRGVEVKELLEKWRGKEESGEVVLGEAEDTLGNARETAGWMRREKLHVCFLVTANYHMRRAQLVFRTLAPDITAIPWPVEPEGLDLRNWWRIPEQRELVLREYLKYLVMLPWSAVKGAES